MTASKISLYFCLALVGGIFVSSIFRISQLLMLGLLILGIFLICVFWRYPIRKPSASNGAGKKIVVVGFCVLFLVLGIWRHESAISKIPLVEERNVSFTAEVVREPAIGEKSTKLVIKPENIDGKILLTVNRYPEYQYGDKLQITGKLEAPAKDLPAGRQGIDGFNYQDYLKKDGIFAVMYWPKIELVGSGFGNPVMSALFSFKNKFKEATSRFISPPQQGILEALFFGDEEKISQEWKNKLNLTGTRHITAVSGMNITIISVLLMNFLLALGFWRKQAFYFSVLLLLLYILMIGEPASAVRAGIMAGALITAQYLGRMSQAARAVVFAAVLILLFNPLLLKLDVGFQLSFLAILGIIYLQPSFSNWLRKIPNAKAFPLRTTLTTTLSAQIFTWPILIYNFGYVSLLSTITNILIVPFLAPITILIFIFGLSAMIFSPLGCILSWPTWLALTYLLGIIDGFSKLSFSHLVLENIPWAWLMFAYLILGFIAWRLNKRQTINVI